METLRKGSNEYIISRINSTISALVYDKVQMRKAYNYYNGILDRDQYKHIEETYGISCPTNIEFIPLTKKHIDALVGELQGQPINRKISCKDSATLSNIFRDKQKYVLDNVRKKYMQDLYYKVYKTFVDSNIIPPRDLISEKYIEELSSDLDKNYISEYEMAAQNIITWVIQSRDINLINKVIALFRDLLITGTCYYRMLPSINKTNINLEVLSPLDTFVEKNPNSNYLKDCSRCCIRYYFTKDQILSKYGSELSASDKDKLMNGSGTSSESYSSDNTYIVRSNYPVGASEDPANESTGILGGLCAYIAMGQLAYAYVQVIAMVQNIFTLSFCFSSGRETGVSSILFSSGLISSTGLFSSIGKTSSIGFSFRGSNLAFLSFLA